jgi:alkyl hydroperoxide reductase subunit AhpC
MSLQGITATWANTPKQQNNVQLTFDSISDSKLQLLQAAHACNFNCH